MLNDDYESRTNPHLEEVADLDDSPLPTQRRSVTGCDNGRWLAIFVRDEAGELMAGLHGWTWGRTGFVRTLWVREDLRGRGLGARLLGKAEQEAARRGCREVQLDTNSYQAPGFYRRQGYQQIGELPGWPAEGATRVFFRKAL